MRPSPTQLIDAAKGAHSVTGGGGPKRIAVKGIGVPEGLFLQTAEVQLEITRRDGTKAEFSPRIPLPFFWTWVYRLARHLQVPLISALDPERVAFEVTIPGR